MKAQRALLMMVAVLTACTTSAVSTPATVTAPATTGRYTPGGVAGDKVGGSAKPLVISLADSQEKGKPSNLPLTEFAASITRLSGGTMVVEMVYEASGDLTDEPVIADVRSGVFSMAVVPARAWAALGVSSLQALQAPFLLQSDGQLDAVTGDQKISAALMAGLPAVGVTGLALLPDSLRHLFSFTAPITTPADLRGRTVRGPASTDTKAIIEALGARLVSPPYDDFVAGVHDGSISAAESSFVGATSEFTEPSSAAGNLVLYAKATSLVVNSAFFGRLTAAQQQIIRTAADAARVWAAGHRTREDQAAIDYCDKNGQVILLEEAELRAFRQAVGSTYATLRSVPATAALLTSIESLGTTAPPSTSCGTPPVAVGTTLVASAGRLPNGVYRLEVTDEVLRAAGVPEHDFDLNRAVYTVTLRNGHYKIVATPAPDPAVTDGAVITADAGVYSEKANVLQWLVTFVGDTSPSYVVTVPWQLAGGDDLRFSFPANTGSPYDRAFFTPVWKRIGS